MKGTNKLVNWAFLIGAVIAVLYGIGAAIGADYASNKWIQVVLVVLGLAVGFVNITNKETIGFLVAAFALAIFGQFGILVQLDSLIPKLGTLLGYSVQAFSFFVGSAALVVAIKEAWALAAKK